MQNQGAKNIWLSTKYYTKYSWKWLIEWGYELLLGYGERPLRIAAWSGIAILLFSFLYLATDSIGNSVDSQLRFLDHFLFSLATFSTIGFPDLFPSNDLGKILTSFEALIGISALALLMFSLGNRISRS